MTPRYKKHGKRARNFGRLLLLLAGLHILTFALLGMPQALAAEQRCLDERTFRGYEYWFWRAFKGLENVHREGDEIVGDIANYNMCFRVPRAAIDDPQARLIGVKRAAEELRKAIYMNVPEASEFERKFSSIVGREFSSRAELQAWWLENNDYLVWSEAKQHLVVDENAKEKKQPIVPLHPVQQLSPEGYWYLQGMGWIDEVHEKDGVLSGKAWGGDKAIKFSIPKADLTNAPAKERGYRQAAETIIEHRLTAPELGKEGERDLIDRLRQLTTEDFSDRQTWIAWWRANKDRLVLSADGQKLVVQARK